MLFTKKRLHKIKKTKNQSRKNYKKVKGGRRRRRRVRGRSFRRRRKHFNLRTRTLKKYKKQRGGNDKKLVMRGDSVFLDNLNIKPYHEAHDNLIVGFLHPNNSLYKGMKLIFFF